VCPGGARTRQLPLGNSGAQRRARAAGATRINGTAPGLGILEAAPPLTQKWSGNQAQAHAAYVSGTGPEPAPAPKKAGTYPRPAALRRARDGQRLLVARFYQRRVDGWRRFRTLNVRDAYNRQLLGVEIDFSLPAARVVQLLTRLVECYGRPAQLRPDNGPEFISARLSAWCEAQGVTLCWIQPGKPTQNAYSERFNGSFRRELLDAHLFRLLAHVRQLVDEWMHDYNTQRPHQALNFMAPIEFKQAA
jgi:putative transposase